MKRVCLFLLLIGLCLFQSHSVQAQSAPSCSFQPDGSIVCTTAEAAEAETVVEEAIPSRLFVRLMTTRPETVYRPEPSMGEGVCSIWEYGWITARA